MEYLNNPTIKSAIDNGATYQKSAMTLLRKPTPKEIGKEFDTFVKDGETVRKESSNLVTGEVIIARNHTVIGQDKNGLLIFNEWLIPLSTAIKNYGQDVVESLAYDIYSDHKKKATLKAIEINQNVLDTLDVKGDILEITVSWSKEPMLAKIGDYLTDGGYSISQHDMKNYEKV